MEHCRLDDFLLIWFCVRRGGQRDPDQHPFFKRQEINPLLDYKRLSRAYQNPLTEASGKGVLNAANKPSPILSEGLLWPGAGIVGGQGVQQGCHLRAECLGLGRHGIRTVGRYG